MQNDTGKRSICLPIRVFWDGTVTLEQEDVIREAYSEMADAVIFDKTQIKYYGNWHSKKYSDLSPFTSVERFIHAYLDTSKQQVAADKVTVALTQFPYGDISQRCTVFFTNLDLFFNDCDFVIGAARSNVGAIISFGRLESISDPLLRMETQKTEIFHEVGHVLGLPTDRRGLSKLDDSLGLHCLEIGCSMKQGMNVPLDWEEITVDRIRLGGQPICNECIEDLKTIMKLR